MKKTKRPLVSVCCITYNHEPYIRDAIEGFLMQKTNFPIEIIIHDDASTDGTAEIVKEYADKHPNLIIPILQKENQHSRGIKISSTYIYPTTNGKYIAKCEGDDYWTDPLKLQKQFDFMEKNKKYIISCHNSLIDYTHFNTRIKTRLAKLHDTKEIDIKYMFENTDVNMTYPHLICPGHTSSVFIRNSENLFNDFPRWVSQSLSGDIATWIYLLSKGKGYFLNEIMSVYRKNIHGITNSNSFSGINFYKNRISLYKSADEFTNFQYHKIIEKSVMRYKLAITTYPLKLFKKWISKSLNQFKNIIYPTAN